LKQDKTEELLSREAYYGLTREYLENLLVLSTLSSERKALGIVYYLLAFVQGKRRFPRKDEVSEVVSDCLDRNLDKEAFFDKWQLNHSRDPSVDNPEEYYLELVQKLLLLQQIREGWNDWKDGDLDPSERPKSHKRRKVDD